MTEPFTDTGFGLYVDTRRVFKEMYYNYEFEYAKNV